MNNALNKNELHYWKKTGALMLSGSLSLKSVNYVRPSAILSYFSFTLKSVELKHVANKGRRKEIC